MYEDLKAFKKLLDEGAITEEDYAKQKIRILGLGGDGSATASTAKSPSPTPAQIEDPSARYPYVPAANEIKSDRVAKELRNYKGFLDEELLARDEFSAKKAKLLKLKPERRQPVVDAKAVGETVEKARKKLPDSKQVGSACAKGGAMVLSGIRKLFSALVFLLCVLQILLFFYAMFQVELFDYLARRSFGHLFSPDLIAGFLLLMGTLINGIATHPQASILNMLGGEPYQKGKKLVAASTVLGLIALVLLMYARDGKTLFEYYYYYEFDFIALFFVVSLLLSFVAVSVANEERR